MTDRYFDVCDECGRHVVTAGHSPDCSSADEEGDHE